jgi:hypothetical protein
MRVLERRLRELEVGLLPPAETAESRRLHEIVLGIRRARAARLGLPEPEEIPTPAYSGRTQTTRTPDNPCVLYAFGRQVGGPFGRASSKGRFCSTTGTLANQSKNGARAIHDPPFAIGRLNLRPWLAAGRHLTKLFEGWIVATPDRRKFAVRITSYPELDISIPFERNATADDYLD